MYHCWLLASLFVLDTTLDAVDSRCWVQQWSPNRGMCRFCMISKHDMFRRGWQKGRGEFRKLLFGNNCVGFGCNVERFGSQDTTLQWHIPISGDTELNDSRTSSVSVFLYLDKYNASGRQRGGVVFHKTYKKGEGEFRTLSLICIRFVFWTWTLNGWGDKKQHWNGAYEFSMTLNTIKVPDRECASLVLFGDKTKKRSRGGGCFNKNNVSVAKQNHSTNLKLGPILARLLCPRLRFFADK